MTTKQQARLIFRTAKRELEKFDEGLVLAGCPHCGEFQTRETYVTGFWVEKVEIVTDYTCMGVSLCKCGQWSQWMH